VKFGKSEKLHMGGIVIQGPLDWLRIRASQAPPQSSDERPDRPRQPEKCRADPKTGQPPFEPFQLLKRAITVRHGHDKNPRRIQKLIQSFEISLRVSEVLQDFRADNHVKTLVPFQEILQVADSITDIIVWILLDSGVY